MWGKWCIHGSTQDKFISFCWINIFWTQTSCYSCHGRQNCSLSWRRSGYGECRKRRRNFVYVLYSCHKCVYLLLLLWCEESKEARFFLSSRLNCFVPVEPSGALLLNQNGTLSGQTQIDLLSPNYPCFAPQEVFNTSCTVRQVLCCVPRQNISSEQQNQTSNVNRNGRRKSVKFACLTVIMLQYL